MLLKVLSLMAVLQGALAQQSHPQLQAYLAQQQQLQQQQQQHQQPARQQYRLIQAAAAAQAPQRYVQQYADEEGAAQYQQVSAVPAPRAQPQYQPQQYQPQQPLYRTAPVAQPQLRLRPGGPGAPAQPEQELQNPEDYDPNPQYQFGFDVKDDQFTNYQNRKEQRDGDKITGSYSVVDSDGFIRTVTYTADPKEGFKAEVTRTPTDIVVKLPQPPQQLPESHGLQRQQLSARPQQYLQATQAGPEPQPQQQPQHAQQYIRPSAAYAQPTPAQLQQLQLLAAQQRQHGGQLLRASPSSSAAAHQAAAVAAASRAAAAQQAYSAQAAASGEQAVYQSYQHQQQ